MAGVNATVLIRRIPWSVVVCSWVLTSIGLVSIARAEHLAGGSGRLFWQQAVFAAVACCVLLVASMLNYRVLCRWSYAALAVSLVLLVLVYFFPRVNGAHRWIRLGPVGFQPSELAKLAFVLALARWLMYGENYRHLRGLVIPLALALLPVILILREPDLGTALVFVPVLLTMLFAAGARIRDLAIVILLGTFTLPLIWSQMSREQKSRVTALISQTGPGDRPDDDQFHLHRAKRMLAVGGFLGTLFNGGIEVDAGRYFVPAAATDSVLCVIGERFGLMGIGATLSVYVMLIWRCLAMARRTQEPFGRLLAVGVAALISVQVLINAGMMVGLLPITGLSLPLVSYGGTGLVANALALGLVLNVGFRPGYEVAGEPFRFADDRRAA